MKICFSIFNFFLLQNIFAQTDTTKKLTFSGYGEIYYSYDFAKPNNNEKANFLYNHKKHNEVNANLLLVKANYTEEKYRANLALMAGNYAQYNLSSEPTWAQFINEANIGIKISKQKNIWVDAGIMPSHIGFESAISNDCWTLTRSILAENSPYYEAGVKISYTSTNEKFFGSAMYLNGWQKISKPNFIQAPSFGLQLTYKPNSKSTLNYSNFIGADKPDSLNALRLFHNFYLQHETDKNFGVIIGFDIGTEKNKTKKYDAWFSPVLIVRQQITKKAKLALRAEYYSDKNQIIISNPNINGFKVFGLSSNIDYAIAKNILLRLEGKMYSGKEKIVYYNNNKNYSLTTNLTVKL
jgi:hypothetical protein